ncbi:ATP-grasp domain-containing protein [Pseudochelatococcus sp. B33]
MAPLLENRIKGLLGQHGMRVPKGVTISSVDEAPSAARTIGFPSVVKALVPIGKKGKAGGVRFPEDEAALRACTQALLGETIRGFRADSVLVEVKAPIVDELFLSFNFDGLLRGPVLLMGTLGGVDVEEAVLDRPDAFARVPLDVTQEYDADFFIDKWKQLGLDAGKSAAAGAATAAAYEVFRRYDVRVLEINPLAIDADGEAVAVGALMDVDDDSLFRQPELSEWVEYGSGRLGRLPTPLEREILHLNATEPSGSLRFMELDGDLGLLISGGGCSLWSADHIIDGGGRPATYFDATVPTEKMWRTLFRGVLSLPRVRGLMFGSNIINLTPIVTRVRYLVETIEELNIDTEAFPVVLRMAGAGEEEAREIAKRIPHLQYYGDEVTLDQALDAFLAAVEKAKAKDHT